LSLLFLALPARAVPPGPPPIINGVVERDYPSTVGLGAAGFTICTGNLITPRVVLTAAHCQADLPLDLLVAFGVAIVGTEASDPKHELALSAASIHPDYRELSGAFLGENDVGVAILEEDAPDDVPPVWIRTAPFTRRDIVGETVTSVGFGLTETNESGVKHSAPLVVSDLDPMFLISESAGNEDGANICSGDSGGPQFHERDGIVEQVAVHSWGDLNCRYNSGSTRTDVVADWILAQVEDVHGTTDFCEITGKYGDGACDPTCERTDPDCVTTIADLVTYGDVRGCDTSGVGGLPIGVLAALGLLVRRGR
jgi:secreted trypsin-like serine protease